MSSDYFARYGLKFVESGFSRQVCSLRKLLRSEVAHMLFAPSYANLCPPLPPYGAHARVAAGVVRSRPHVLAVLRPSSPTQIHQLIVGSITIAVVYVGDREATMHVEPRQTVVLVILAVNHGGPVTAIAYRPYDGADGFTPFAAFQVGKFPGQRVIRQEFFEAGLGQHDAPYQCGYR